MGTIWLQFAVIILLMLANGFFAASEIAIVSARRGRLQQRAESGNRGAHVALELAQEPNRFLATVQVGISLIGTFAAAFGGDALAGPLARRLSPVVGPGSANAVALMLVVLLITYLSLILGELVPKRLAMQQAEAVATFVAPIMRLIARLAAPIVWFLTVSTQAVLTLLGRGRAVEEPVTEEDVLSLVREGAQVGTVEPTEQQIIQNVFELTDRTVRSIMTPRTALMAVALDTPFDAAVERILASGYSRIPVYEGSLDNVVGILHVKDLLGALYRRVGEQAPPAPLQDLLHPPVFVPGHLRVAALLQPFQQGRTHLAVVVDEYGQVDGIVTLEDVLEELTGDIADEYDAADMTVVRRPDGSFLVDGRLSYPDAVERIGLPPRDELELEDLGDFDTVAGFLLVLLGHIPRVGEAATWHGWRFEVVDMDGVRIDRVLISRPRSKAEAQDEGALALGAVMPPLPADPAHQRRSGEEQERSS